VRGLSTNNLPRELIDFISQRNNILLIKGNPGTGKTILSLELLNHFKEDRNGIYVSTRVTSERLFAQFPWLKDVIKPEHVLEAPKKAIVITDTKMKSYLTSFEHVYNLIMRVNNPMIVIDSWEGIVRDLGPEEAESALRRLETLISSKNVSIILVSETPDLTTIDYLADGIVTLSDIDVLGEAINGRTWSGLLERRSAREITLNKLRGTRRKRKNYAYTLKGGRFKYFPPLKPVYLKKFGIIPDPGKDKISSGISDLDKLLGGGYKTGTSTIFELEHGVGNEHLHFLIFPTMINTLLLGRGLVITPLEGLSVEEYLKSSHEIVDKNIDNVMIAQKAMHDRPIPKNRFFVYLRDLNKTLESWFAVRSKLREQAKQPIVHMMAADFMEYSLGADVTVLGVAMNLSAINEWGDVYISIVKREQKITDQISHMCDKHFVLKNVNGAICIYGVRPETKLYNISVTDEGVELTPIV